MGGGETAEVEGEAESDEEEAKEPRRKNMGTVGKPRRVGKGLWKPLLRDSEAPLEVSSIRFGLMSPDEMARAAHMQVVTGDLYQMPERTGMPGGPLDSRLGAIDKLSTCSTCSLNQADCPGHFGYIRLSLPVFHVGYMKAVLKILQMVCKKCSKVLLNPVERQNYLHKLRSLGEIESKFLRAALLNEVWEKSRKVEFCPYCGATNGAVKKIGVFRIVHYPDGSRLPPKKAEHVLSERYEVEPLNSEDVEPHLRFALHANPDLGKHIAKAADDLNPLRALSILEAIPPEDVRLLDMDPAVSSPASLIIQALSVPPLTVRPTVCANPASGSTEDDLTMQARLIMSYNKIISLHMKKGSSTAVLADMWEWLQTEVARYINSELPRLNPSRDLYGDRPLRGISQRLKGKHGRFRGSLSGKRVDFSARTVISPDPNLRIDQVGVPEHVAKTLTYPEKVTKYNIRRLRAAVVRGCDVHPGANMVQIYIGGERRLLKYGNRKAIAKELKPGSIVERHLIDGDVVLFNRQPSLHRVSIMCHRVKVMPHRTFRFNECVCAPYNADFDGDEMNLHVPQTEEARAEALELVGVFGNLSTPRHGQLLVAPTQDFLTASFLVTRKDMFMDRAEFCRAACLMFDAEHYVDLPPPAIIKPLELWTGKQLFTLLISSAVAAVAGPGKEPSFTSESREASYSLKGVASDKHPAFLCSRDGFVYFRRGKLICGQLGKKSLGGSKTSILFALAREYGPEAVATAMNSLAKFASRWLSDAGFSIGVDDVTPSEELIEVKASLVESSYKLCGENIEKYRRGKLKRQPGFSLEESLEAIIKSDLSKIREDVGHACIREMDPQANAALTMALCGSKGSNINIAQMSSCVGQQIVSGSRAPEGFYGRALPHFEAGLAAKTPAAKGFVSNSFYSGLTSTEFFFHTMGGREGLVDTSVKTAETGYMQRRLVKALEDLSVQYDQTVRSSNGSIVQVCYGEDGLDPKEMEENDGKLMNYERTMANSVVAVSSCKEPYMNADEFRRQIAMFLDRDSELSNCCNEHVRKEIEVYLLSLADRHARMSNMLKRMSLENDRARKAMYDAAYGYRAVQLKEFILRVIRKVKNAIVEAGTAVGAIGAQSIGEPGTQMTLKTFHFAGVASMNVTQGVPRLKEIINASRTISTPIIKAPLVSNYDEKSARIVRGRIESTKLGELALFIKEVYRSGTAYIVIRLDLQTIQKVQLDTDIYKVAFAILAHPKLKVRAADISIIRPDKIRIRPREKIVKRDGQNKTEDYLFYQIQQLKTQLPGVIVEGISTAQRAVISETRCEKTGGKSFELLVEGDDLTSVMVAPGVHGEKTSCNHVIAVEKTLGIEAARKTIIDQINCTMMEFGISIDIRHLMLLADCMTSLGFVLGITRFGISKMRTSTLMLASFETTAEHLFSAALHSRRDNIAGVSERIIMGVPIPLGTGSFRLIRQSHPEACQSKRRRDILLKSSMPRHVDL